MWLQHRVLRKRSCVVSPALRLAMHALQQCGLVRDSLTDSLSEGKPAVAALEAEGDRRLEPSRAEKRTGGVELVETNYCTELLTSSMSACCLLLQAAPSVRA
jgi:hypothetical protein